MWTWGGGGGKSKSKRETGFEPVTLRAAIESSTTELPARRKQTFHRQKQTPLERPNQNLHQHTHTQCFYTASTHIHTNARAHTQRHAHDPTSCKRIRGFVMQEGCTHNAMNPIQRLRRSATTVSSRAGGTLCRVLPERGRHRPHVGYIVPPPRAAP